MKILYIGGTGNISHACVKESIARGDKVYLLNRGNHKDRIPPQAVLIKADLQDREKCREKLEGMSFDIVIQFIGYRPSQIKADIELFQGRCGQYVFISSASVYHKPVPRYITTESTSACNPYWEYSQNKIACEQLLLDALRQDGFPATIVRPSHTYGDGWIPTSFGSKDYTVPSRMLAGKEIVIHGDGTSLWTLTHSEDFARGFCGLLGHPLAAGEIFHITSDEVLTWNQIHEILADALGVKPRIVHIPSDIIARYSPQRGPSLLGDKAYCAVFDNSKVKSLVPDFIQHIPYYRGLRRSLQWFDEHPEMKKPIEKTDNEIDSLLAAWRKLDLT